MKRLNLYEVKEIFSINTVAISQLTHAIGRLTQHVVNWSSCLLRLAHSFTLLKDILMHLLLNFFSIDKLVERITFEIRILRY